MAKQLPCAYLYASQLDVYVELEKDPDNNKPVLCFPSFKTGYTITNTYFNNEVDSYKS